MWLPVGLHLVPVHVKYLSTCGREHTLHMLRETRFVLHVPSSSCAGKRLLIITVIGIITVTIVVVVLYTTSVIIIINIVVIICHYHYQYH